MNIIATHTKYVRIYVDLKLWTDVNYPVGEADVSAALTIAVCRRKSFLHLLFISYSISRDPHLDFTYRSRDAPMLSRSRITYHKNWRLRRHFCSLRDPGPHQVLYPFLNWIQCNKSIMKYVSKSVPGLAAIGVTYGG